MSDIVAFARECINTPFRHQGRVINVGLDCAGVVIHCATRAGVAHADMQGYSRLPYRGMLQDFLNAQPNLLKIPVEEMAAGDVILMQIKQAPGHLGIYSGNGYMIHAYDDAKKTVENRMDETWLKRITAVYRFVR